MVDNDHEYDQYITSMKCRCNGQPFFGDNRKIIEFIHFSSITYVCNEEIFLLCGNYRQCAYPSVKRYSKKSLQTLSLPTCTCWLSSNQLTSQFANAIYCIFLRHVQLPDPCGSVTTCMSGPELPILLKRSYNRAVTTRDGVTARLRSSEYDNKCEQFEWMVFRNIIS